MKYTYTDDDLLELLLRQIKTIVVDTKDVDEKVVSTTIVYTNGGETDCELPKNLLDYLINRFRSVRGCFGSPNGRSDEREEARMQKATDKWASLGLSDDPSAWLRTLNKEGVKQCLERKEFPAIRHVVEGEKGGCRLVTVVFKDGTRETVKCADGDDYDVNVGAALCVAYKAFGSRTAFRNEVAAKTAKPKPKKAKPEAKKKPAEGKPKARRGRPKKVLNEASKGK